MLAREIASRRAARLRRLLDEDLGTTVTRSAAEERSLALVRASELPSPRLNARVGATLGRELAG